MLDGTVRGAWLWTGDRLIERGGVSVRGGVVEAVLGGRDRDPAGLEVLDLPRALLHPGLLNAHAHLDLSRLDGASLRDLPFAMWLDRVRRHRLEAGRTGLDVAAGEGLRALIADGAARIVDHSWAGISEAAMRSGGAGGAVLLEVIGPMPARAERAAAEAEEWIRGRIAAGALAFGLAPHSPYLATAELIRACRRIAAGRPFSIHAAEVADEARMLRDGTGPLRDLLEGLGIDLAGFEPPGCGPIEHLERLGALERTLLVHAGVLERGDIERIRAGGAAVVFCPGTHRYFHRGTHPLPELLAAGVPAALGTDSAASNRGLAVSEEMREARRMFPRLSARAIFDLGTGALLDGRGILPGLGRIVPAEPAGLAAAEVSPGPDPLEAFLREGARNLLTIAGGRVLYRSTGL